MPIPSLLRSALLITFCVGTALRASTPVELRLDAAKSYGAWEGWGTSLAWMGKAYGDSERLADVLYTGNTVEFSGQPPTRPTLQHTSLQHGRQLLEHPRRRASHG